MTDRHTFTGPLHELIAVAFMWLGIHTVARRLTRRNMRIFEEN